MTKCQTNLFLSNSGIKVELWLIWPLKRPNGNHDSKHLRRGSAEDHARPI